MLKRTLVVIATLALFATTNAFASRAKELVMGTGDAGLVLSGGSLYYDDAYNMFYNPAYINDFKNWAIIEKSNFQGSTAQGGFVASMANFNVGLYMNRGNALTGSYTNSAQYRPIEFTLGADMGVKWGVTLQYGAFTGSTGTAPSVTTSDGNDFTVRAGAEVGNLEPYASVKLSGRSTVGGVDTNNKGFTVGTRYKMGEWTPYFAYNQLKSNDTTTNSSYVVGLGRSKKLTEGVKMYYSLSYVREAIINHNVIPVDFSVEADAASWLSFMAGLNYRFLDKVAGNNNTDNTTGRVGANVHMGKSELEWAFGKSVTATEAATSADTQVLDIGSGFFTAMSFAYHW